MKCVIENCDRKVAIWKHGLCSAHVREFYRHGKVHNKKVRKMRLHSPFKPNKGVIGD